MGNLVIFAAALFASLQRNYPDLFGRINPGLAGLSITYALQVYYIQFSVLGTEMAFLHVTQFLTDYFCINLDG